MSHDDHEPINRVSVQQKTVNKKLYQFHFPEWGWLVSLASLSFLLPQNMELDTAPANLPSATIGQRIWSAVSTFFHGVFMGYVLVFPVGLVAGLCLRFSDANVTRSTIEALRSGSILLGMVTATLLLPLLWRGHSFGQRSLGIIVVPATGEDIENLSGSAIMMRRLTFRTHCVCAQPMLSRPWNSALIPFVSAITLHLVMIPLAGAFLWITSTLDNSSRQSSINSHPHKEATVNFVTSTQHTLHQIDPAMRSYIVEFGMIPKPLTRKVFKEVLDYYISPGVADTLLKKLDMGNLKLQGDLAEYRIGIYENDQWTILNEQGEIHQEKEF